MSDLEVTANAPSPSGNREHIIPRGPHHLSAREDAGEEPAIVLLHGFPDNQHLSDRLVPPPCPTTRALQPYRATWPEGLGSPTGCCGAAAPVDGIAVTLARAALAPRSRPRYRPGLRNRLSTRLLTTLPPGRRIGSRRGSPAWQAPPTGRTRPRRRRHAAVAPQHPPIRAPTPRGHASEPLR
jgi:hypothetical protein